jgi:hypothetical protein
LGAGGTVVEAERERSRGLWRTEISLAVYTTIYPGVEKYLAAWYRSLREQTDLDFELWIGLDLLDKEDVEKQFGFDPSANWVVPVRGATPAEIREKAIQRIVEKHSELVLVDSDDLLLPTRIEAARAALCKCDLAGCALQLVDEKGDYLDSTFQLPQSIDLADVFPRNNVFGFSNSAFRSDLLARCLPIPPDSVLVDWFLATRAWLFGARVSFDRTPRMCYRQHAANIAHVGPPYTCERIVSDAALVRRHLQLVLASSNDGYLTDRYTKLCELAGEVEEFYHRVVLDRAKLDDYVKAINQANLLVIWWACVAYPDLQYMWKK